MSYSNGIAAINLELTQRVCRSEFSADQHWELVTAVTGINVTERSSPELREKASCAFVKAWGYDFVWSTLIHNQPLGDFRTSMGHAFYSAGGIDYRDDRDQLPCPFRTPEEALMFDPAAVYKVINHADTVALFNEHYHKQCRKYPDAVNCTGIYITLISGLIEIFGWDMLLLAAGTNPAGFGAVANRYATWVQRYFDALADSESPVVMVHDDIVWTSGAFLSPQWYREFIFPNYKKYFAPLQETGKKIVFTSDGNYTEFIDDIADCGINGFVLEPTTDMTYIAKRYGNTHTFQGNFDTRILLYGNKDEIRAEVKRCMDTGKSYPGFFLSVSNHIPPNTPVESALFYNQCYEEMAIRW